LCSRIEQPQRLRRLDLFDGRRRIAFYAGRVPAALPATAHSDDQCLLWQQAYAAESSGR
jgi:hypothetical protein